MPGVALIKVSAIAIKPRPITASVRVGDSDGGGEAATPHRPAGHDGYFMT